MFRHTLIIGALISLSTSATAEDFDPAHHLETQCSSCHGDTIYTRPDRRAKSLKQLGRIVRRCERNLATGLFDDEVDILTNHINETYYKFK